MKIATIDIGTNTILLLIAEVLPNGTFKILHDEQVIARLGKGVDANRSINQETFRRAESFLGDYKNTCANHGVDHIVAVGTSALRDASNKIEFLKHINSTCNLDIEILSGDEEALWTFQGGISEFREIAEIFSVIDIGGGSTEIIIGTSVKILSKISLDIGSVRITERILKESPPEHSALIDAYQFIQSQIPDTTINGLRSTFSIGVAGTVTTLAALHQQLPTFIAEKISGYKLTFENVSSLFSSLKEKSIQQLLLYPQISTGRADIILTGILILMTVMEKSKMESITVSTRGLRYGILLREIEKYSSKRMFF